MSLIRICKTDLTSRRLLGCLAGLAPLLLLPLISFSLATSSSSNATSGETIINASIARPAFVLSISVAPTVNLDLSPTADGTMTIGSSSIAVSTSSPSGFRLYLGMTGTNSTTNSLIHTVDNTKTITSSGTLASPTALSNGTWGYAFSGTRTAENPVVSNNGFDATYTTQESATPTSAKFAAVPVSTAPAEKVAETNALGDASLTVYYGIKAGYETASGSYTNKVLYTALADNAPTHTATVSPDTVLDTGGETILVTTPLYTTVENYAANAYLLTETEYQAVTRAQNPDPISTYSSSQMTCSKTQSDALQLQCTTIEIEAGTAYVYLDVPHFSEYYAIPITVESSAPQFFRITNMQDMTTAICNSATTPNASATNVDTDGSHDGDPTYVAQRTLYDIRDNKSYTVRKLADGNCWMVDNLKLTGSRTLTPANSDVSSDWTLPAANSSFPTSCQDTAYNMNSGNATYGNYYNWYAATAGTGTCAMTSGEATASICPKGWRLPTGGSNGEFQALYSQYSSSTLMQGDPGFVLSGYRYGSSTYDQGGYGRYWSSTAVNAGNAYNLYLGSSGVNSAGYNGKFDGFTVRCVAK